MTIRLTLLDEVNCHFDGLSLAELKACQKAVSFQIPGAFMTAAFKAGISDGYESLMSDDGFTYIFLIDRLLTVLEEQMGIDINVIQLDDERETVHLDNIPLIDEDWLLEETGMKLREHQIDAINTALTEQKGIFDLATNAGKTLICLGISKALNPFIRTIVIVPSEKLLRQTYADYKKSSLNTLMLESKIVPKKREALIKEVRHIIMTVGMFQNCIHLLHERYALMFDECHVFGDVTADALRFELAHCPIRLGFTGTVPKDKLKAHKLKSILGGDVLQVMTTKELRDKGYASSIHIELFTTSHREFEEHIDELSSDRELEGADVYSVEEAYLNKNKDRIEAIAEFIKSLEIKNTLVLCHKEHGVNLAPLLGSTMIYDDTDTDTRDELFNRFSKRRDVIQVASYGTSSTGISENDIFRLIFIDPGKNETRVKQSIGRVLRLDGTINHADVIDISANTKYSKKHRKDREKIYKQESYEYDINNNFIMVV